MQNIFIYYTEIVDTSDIRVHVLDIDYREIT